MEGEYQFSFYAYPLTKAQAQALRDKIEAAILAVVEAEQGVYVSPVEVDYSGPAMGVNDDNKIEKP